MNKKFLVYIALVVFILGVTAYSANYWWTGTPEHSLRQLRSAVQNHDVELAFQYIDFEKVFEGFWEDLSSKATEGIGKSGDGFEAFGAVLGMTILENMKSTLKIASKKALEKAIRGENGGEKNTVATTNKPTLTKNIKEGKYEIIRNKNKVYLELEGGMKLTFVQHPDRYWQVIHIDGMDFSGNEELNKE